VYDRGLGAAFGFYIQINAAEARESVVIRIMFSIRPKPSRSVPEKADPVIGPARDMAIGFELR
jgi:hypothetical protein